MPRASASGIGASADRGSQGLAVEQLRDEKRAAARHADVEHLDDVGVVERGGDPRFLQEPLDRVAVAAFRAGQRFEGDVSTEPRIGRPVDVSHSAASQQGHDPVRADRGAFRKRGLVLRQIAGGEDQGRRFEKPVDRSTGGGELVGHLKELRVLGGEAGSQRGALIAGCGQPRVVPVRQDAPSLGVHSWPRLESV